jgi:hypothetical protein
LWILNELIYTTNFQKFLYKENTTYSISYYEPSVLDFGLRAALHLYLTHFLNEIIFQTFGGKSSQMKHALENVDKKQA